MKTKKLINNIFTGITIAGFIFLSSCSKDNTNILDKCNADVPLQQSVSSPNIKTNPEMDYFSIHAISVEQNDYYTLIDFDSSIFEWKSFEDGSFLFHKEIKWIFDKEIIKFDSITTNSFIAHFDDGSSLKVFNVNTFGQTTTCNVYNENGHLVTITTQHSIPFDFMGAILEMNKICNTKIAPYVFTAAKIIYGTACTIILIYDCVQTINCEKQMKQAATICEQNSHCRAIKHQCSLECIRKYENCICDCKSKDWHGN